MRWGTTIWEPCWPQNSPTRRRPVSARPSTLAGSGRGSRCTCKAFADQGKLDEAKAALESAAPGEDKHVEAELHLANKLRRQGAGGSRRRLRTLLEGKPDLSDAHHCLGLVLSDQGEFAAAAAAIHQALTSGRTGSL